MKTTLCTLAAITAFFPAPVLAQSPAAPPASSAADMIRKTKAKALQRHLEAAYVEKLEIEKQLLSAPAAQQEPLKTKAASLAKFIESLEAELQQIQSAPPAPRKAPDGPRVGIAAGIGHVRAIPNPAGGAPQTYAHTLTELGAAQNIALEPWLVLQDPQAAQQYRTLIFAATTIFGEQQKANLTQYFETPGNSLLILLDSEHDCPELNAWLKTYGVDPRADRVMHTESTPAGPVKYLNANARFLAGSPLNRGLENRSTVLPGSTRSLNLLTDLKAVKDGNIRLTSLLEPDREFWGEKNYTQDLPVFDKNEDTAPPLCIAVAVERDAPPNQYQLPTQSSRMVVIGNMDLVMPPPSQINNDFLARSLNWLLHREVPSPGNPGAVQKVDSTDQRKAAYERAKAMEDGRTEKEDALRKSIAKLREAAAASLKQRAASSEASVSTALLSEARRLGLIKPETPLLASQNMQSLAGVWEHGLAPYRQGSFTPNGLTVKPDGTPHGTWSWLDEEQKIFFVDDDSKWMNLCRIKDANTIESVVIDGSQFKYTRKSNVPAPAPPLPDSSEELANLAAAEKSLRDEAAASWQKEQETVTALLESLLPELPEPNKTGLAGSIAKLRAEKIFQIRTEPTMGLAGKWVVEGRILEFLSGGKVRVNGEEKGQWLWGKKRSKGHIVFTLGPGQLTAIGNLGDKSMELQIIGENAKHAMKL